MVLTGIILLLGLGLAFFFRENIGNFLEGFKPIEQAGEVVAGVKKEGEKAGETFGERVVLPINITIVERRLEKEAMDKGFLPREITFDVNGVPTTRISTSKQEQELALDAGDFVIGGKVKEIEFGLIGDILPTDPSQFFLDNRERLLTPDQLLRFNKIFGGQGTTKMILTPAQATGTGTASDPFKGQQPDPDLVSPFLKPKITSTRIRGQTRFGR